MSDQEIAAVVSVIVAVSALVHAGLAVAGFLGGRRRATTGEVRDSAGLGAVLASGRWRLLVVAFLHAIPLAFALSLAVAGDPAAILMGALWVGGLGFAVLGVVSLALSRLPADSPSAQALTRILGFGQLVGGALVVLAMATLR